MRTEVNYAMSEAEIAAELGISKAVVRTTLIRAIAKIRAHPQVCASFRAAVQERRCAMDARLIPYSTSDRDWLGCE